MPQCTRDKQFETISKNQRYQKYLLWFSILVGVGAEIIGSYWHNIGVAG